MIYELRNKTPQNSSFIYSEDVLTSTIFGNLRYFSSQKLLIDFLNQSTDIEDKSLVLTKEAPFILYFWEKYTMLNYSKINEPDLILWNKKDTIVIIECKYFSFLNENGDIVNTLKNMITN
jgi:hypothetical protein